MRANNHALQTASPLPVTSWRILRLGIVAGILCFSTVRYHANAVKEIVCGFSAVLAFSIMLMDAVRKGEFRLGCRHPLLVPAGFLLLLQCISLPFCTNIYAGLKAVAWQLVLTAAMILAGESDCPKRLHHLAHVFSWTGLLTSAYAFLQVSWKDPILQQKLLLPIATLGNSNFAANYLLLTIPMSLLLLMQASRMSRKILHGSSAMAQLLFLLGTMSRGAWVGAASACILCIGMFIALRRKDVQATGPSVQWRYPALLLIFVFFCALPFARRVEQEALSMFHLSDPTIRFRLLSWRSTLNMAMSELPMGAGAGNFRIKYPLYATDEEYAIIGADTTTARSHNDYLQVLAELGPAGLGLFCWILYVFFSTTWTRIRRAARHGDAAPYIAAMAAGAAFCVHALFSFPFQLPLSSFLFWTLMGACCVTKRQEALVGKLAPPTRTLLCVMTVVLLGLAGWISYRALSSTRHLGMAERFFRVYMEAPEAKKHIALQQGEAHLLQAENHHWHNQAVHFYRGIVERVKGNLERSVREMEAGKSLAPFSPKILTNLAYAYFHRDNPRDMEKAKDAALEAIRIRKDSYNPYLVLGLSYKRLGQIRAAERALLDATEKAAADPLPLTALGNFYEEQGRDDKAELAYRRLAAMRHHDVQSLLNLSRFYLVIHEHEKAHTCIDAILAKAPDHYRANLYKGLLMELLHAPDQAIALYNKCLSLDENPREAHARLGVLREKAAPREAVGHYQEYIRLQGSDRRIMDRLMQLDKRLVRDAGNLQLEPRYR